MTNVRNEMKDDFVKTYDPWDDYLNTIILLLQLFTGFFIDSYLPDCCKMFRKLIGINLDF